MSKSFVGLAYENVAGTPAEPQSPSVPSEVVQHLQTLIRGIAVHAVEGDSQDLRQFQQRMSGIASGLSSESSAEDVLVSIGATLRSLEEYNQKATAVFNGHANELRAMLTTMTATVMFITASSESSVKQLGVIESKLRQTVSIQDTSSLRSSLDECLSLVRAESARLQSESRAKINSLKNDVDRLTSRLKAVSTEGSNDPVTGLPGRIAAEESMEKKIAAGKECIVALFLIDRLASINGRFGRVIGDEVLISGAQAIAQKLQGATLYRWSGPAFLAIFDPTINSFTAETRAKQAAAIRVEKNIEADDRNVLLLITCSLNIQRLSAKSTPDSIFRAIDAFMAANGAGTTFN